MTKNAFSWSDECEPHKLRTKEIIQKHPGIRNFIGRNRVTFIIILFCVALQTMLAFWLKDVAGIGCCSLLIALVHLSTIHFSFVSMSVLIT